MFKDMIPRLWTRVEGVAIEPSILREKSWVEPLRDFGPTIYCNLVWGSCVASKF